KRRSLNEGDDGLLGSGDGRVRGLFGDWGRGVSEAGGGVLPADSGGRFARSFISGGGFRWGGEAAAGFFDFSVWRAVDLSRRARASAAADAAWAVSDRAGAERPVGRRDGAGAGGGGAAGEGSGDSAAVF